jgi:hypothetical protein
MQADQNVINLSSEREKDVTDRLISCDDLMELRQLPADLWLTRLPPALRDRAPRIDERDATMPPRPGESEAFFVDGTWRPTL